jgi:hypothetical protein
LLSGATLPALYSVLRQDLVNFVPAGLELFLFYLFIYLFIYLLVELSFEFRALSLLGRASTT